MTQYSEKYNVEELITLWWHTPSNEGYGPPILFTGDPGEAKSGYMKYIARKFNVPFLYIDPLAKGDGYSGAVPVIDELESEGVDELLHMGGPPPRRGEKVLRFPPIEPVLRMIRAGVGFIGVDELRNCPVIWQQVLQAMFEAREFGDQKLPVGVRMLACSNSARVATGGRKLSGSFANRFTHVSWHGFGPQETCEYHRRTAKSKFPQVGTTQTASEYSEAAIEKITDEYWEAYLGQANVDVFGGFLIAKPQMKHIEPQPNSPQMDGPWPSTRAWTTVMRWIATYRILNDHTDRKISKDVLRTVVAGTVGDDAAEMFWRYIKARNLPSPEDFITGRAEVELSASVPDIAYTILASAASYVTTLSDKSKQNTMGDLLYAKCAELVGRVGTEIALVGAQPLGEAMIARGSTGQTKWQKAFMSKAR